MSTTGNVQWGLWSWIRHELGLRDHNLVGKIYSVLKNQSWAGNNEKRIKGTVLCSIRGARGVPDAFNEVHLISHHLSMFYGALQATLLYIFWFLLMLTAALGRYFALLCSSLYCQSPDLQPCSVPSLAGSQMGLASGQHWKEGAFFTKQQVVASLGLHLLTDGRVPTALSSPPVICCSCW